MHFNKAFKNPLKIFHSLAAFSGIFSLGQFLIYILISFMTDTKLNAQAGGKAFQFLEVTNSARVAALGGNAVAIYDDDLDLPYHNPALLNLSMHHHLALNYTNYFAGINYGYASAATRLGERNTFAGAIHYLNYGKFQGADENGLLTGSFRAADYSINLIFSRTIDSLLTWGVTVKSVYSDLETYNSTALAVDAGIIYHNPQSRFTAGLVLKNIGFQVNAYYPEGAHEPLPFTIAIGVTQGLQYAPFKFFVLADHLEKWDLTYTTEEEKEQNIDPLTGELISKGGFDVFIDRFMRHIVVGTEVSIGENLVLRAGYNYRRRQEMKINSKPGMVGFSWGVGVKITKFLISYGRTSFHLAGGSNCFSFSINLDEFNKKF
jgi:hypothetical protein